MTLVVTGFIVWRMRQIGWYEVASSMPTNFVVYIYFIAAYIVSPLGDFFIYRRIWGLGWQHLGAMFRKQILNTAVFDYAGEAHFAWLAGRREDNWKVKVAHIKDVNILSAQASNFITVILIILFAETAAFQNLSRQFPDLGIFMTIGALAVSGVMLAIYLLRGRLLRLAGREQVIVLSIHTIRCLLQMALSVAIWHAAIPAVALSDWILFLAATMAINRLPLLPNKVVVTTAVGVALGNQVGAETHAVASLFIVLGALQLILHGVLFLGLRLFDRDHDAQRVAGAT